MAKNRLVSTVIVNWNGRDDLETCLGSLEKIKYKPVEIIVVDNGSTDGSLEYIKNQKSKIKNLKLVKNKKNLGFAEGNNVGYKKSRGELILFLNNDTIVPPDFLDKLVSKISSEKEIAIVQPKIIYYRPGTALHQKINSIGSFLTSAGFLYHQGYGKDPKEKKFNLKTEVFSIHGACFLAKRTFLEKTGLFDPDFFAYFEETDLCQRIWLSGGKILFVPEAEIFHKGAKTAQKLPVPFIQYHAFKNRICSYLKNFSPTYLFRILLPHLIFCAVASLFYVLMGRPLYTLAIYRALFWNLGNIKETWQKRKFVQTKIRRIGDQSFIPRLTRTVRLPYYYALSQGKLEDYQE